MAPGASEPMAIVIIVVVLRLAFIALAYPTTRQQPHRTCNFARHLPAAKGYGRTRRSQSDIKSL